MKMKAAALFKFMRERHSIYLRRKAGEPAPWTKDPIFQKYRFCNVYRELDTVTDWIRRNWREPNQADPDIWFAMIVARLLNLPASLEAIGYPIPWDAKRFKKILKERKAAGEKVFNGAYMIHSNATEGLPKTDYLADHVLTPIWKATQHEKTMTRCLPVTLAGFHEFLLRFRDMGSFMAAQVVADTKFTDLLSKANDWWVWAAPGPGSERGLNRVCGFAVKERWEPGCWLRRLLTLRQQIEPLLKDMPPLSAQDLQNCLCEFDKYERARLGEGRPKQLFTPNP